MDDYSDLSMIHLMKTKTSEENAEAFKILFDNRRKVESLYRDHGREYEGEFRKLMLNRSIEQELSIQRRPTTNSIQERDHIELERVGRAGLIQSGLPGKMWGHSILHGNHNRNRQKRIDANKTVLPSRTCSTCSR